MFVYVSFKPICEVTRDKLQTHISHIYSNTMRQCIFQYSSCEVMYHNIRGTTVGMYATRSLGGVPAPLPYFQKRNIKIELSVLKV